MDGKPKRKRSSYKWKRCIAAGPNNTFCNNKANTPGISLHAFPREDNLRKKWIRFVQRYRPDFQPKTMSIWPVLCSLHFQTSDFIRRPDISVSMGFYDRQRLQKGSVPTIHLGQHSSIEQTTARARRQMIRELLKPDELRLQLDPIPPLTRFHQQEVDLAQIVDFSEVLQEVKIKQEPVDEPLEKYEAAAPVKMNKRTQERESLSCGMDKIPAPFLILKPKNHAANETKALNGENNASSGMTTTDKNKPLSVSHNPSNAIKEMKVCPSCTSFLFSMASSLPPSENDAVINSVLTNDFVKMCPSNILPLAPCDAMSEGDVKVYQAQKDSSVG